MEKIVISSTDIAETMPATEEPRRFEAKLPEPVPLWGKIALSPLVLALPILCLVTLVVRAIMRGRSPRERFGWLAFLSSLLIVSGILTSIAAVVAVSTSPLPSVVSKGLSDLDGRTDFPALPVKATMSARDVSEKLKPLVTVISPALRTWFSHQETPTDAFGAGVVLHADADGYLIATARHVVDELSSGKGKKRALVTTASGIWAGADVVARHNRFDMALLWLPRGAGSAKFTMPIAPASEVGEGQTIYVIGHPEGLRYTLSTGIVSRVAHDAFQISAPISPGNSGGPLFDDRGRLAGIVTSTVDKSSNPNAENLNFAVRADALLDVSGWAFTATGRERLESLLKDLKSQH